METRLLSSACNGACSVVRVLGFVTIAEKLSLAFHAAVASFFRASKIQKFGNERVLLTPTLPSSLDLSGEPFRRLNQQNAGE